MAGIPLYRLQELLDDPRVRALDPTDLVPLELVYDEVAADDIFIRIEQLTAQDGRLLLTVSLVKDTYQVVEIGTGDVIEDGFDSEDAAMEWLEEEIYKGDLEGTVDQYRIDPILDNSKETP